MNGEVHELKFWRAFVQTERFLLGWCGDAPTPELRALVRDFLLLRPEAYVLDVGSGVVSILHGTAKNLVATDLLTYEYAKFFDYKMHGLKQPLSIAAEDLPFHNEFDIVHISNALDHCEDPKQAVRRMLKALKKGGWLIVQSFEDEGSHERWAGMHQWNLRLEDKTLLVHDRIGGYDLGEADSVETYVIGPRRRWFIWMKQK